MALAKVISIIDHEAAKAAQAAAAASLRLAALERSVAELQFQVDGLRGGSNADPR